MQQYEEDLSFNKNFWMKTSVLYDHLAQKFAEFISIGKIFEKLNLLIEEFSSELSVAKKKCEVSDVVKLISLWIDDVDLNEPNKTKKKKIDFIPKNLYIPLKTEDNSSRSKGINMLFDYFDRLINCLNSFNNNLEKISTSIKDKLFNYKTTMSQKKECDENFKKYNDSLIKLKEIKLKYYDSVTYAIKHHLSGKKKDEEKKNILAIDEKRKEYKEQVKLVEANRVEYLGLQGHVFALMDQFERDCTDELKGALQNFSGEINTFVQDIQLTESEKKVIEDIDGLKDNKSYTYENKSLNTGPKRNLFKEYNQDINSYFENFNFLKKQVKGLDHKAINELKKNISREVGTYLNEIIKEEKDEINERILDISRQLKENKLTENDFHYLMIKFDENFNKYLNWKKTENASASDYRKVGEIYDDRFCYMHTFLGYFNKTRVANKCLNEENFNYFCKAIEKILDLNTNEDIDYALCDLVVILSSTFYMEDKTKSNGKKFVTEVIKKSPIMNYAWFWVGLCKFELNQELNSQKSEEETLLEEKGDTPTDTQDKSIFAKLMSITFNILQFVTDSKLFNEVVHSIFDHCKLDKEKREMIIDMIENQIEAEKISYIKIDKDLLLK